MARSSRPRRFHLALNAALLPLAITTLLAYIGSVLWSIRISFSTSRMLPKNDWIGLAQFERLFNTDRWMVSLQHMGILAVVYIGGVIVLGTLMAIFIDQRVKGESWFRTIFLYPFAMSFVVTGLIWQWLFNPGLGLQHAFRELGWESFTFDWTTRQDLVIYAVGIAMVWQGSGTTMAIILAALRGVDEEQWKAAQLEGVSKPRYYFSIVLPQIGPAFATSFVLLAVALVRTFDIVAIILAALRGVDEEQWKAAQLEGVSKPRYYFSIVLPQIGPAFATSFVLLAVALVRTFDIVAIMTRGGPGDASEVPAKFIIDHLFERNNIALASAASVVMLITVFTVLTPMLYWRSKVQARLNAGH